MKKILLIVLSCSLAMNTYAQTSGDSTAGALDLNDCLKIAFENNVDVAQSDIAVQRAWINLQQARMNLLPGINANYSYGINSGRSIDPYTNSFINQEITFSQPNVGAQLLVFNGLGQLHSMHQNSLVYEASKMEKQQAKDNLALTVILSYLQVLTNEELLDQSKKQQTTSQKQVERLEILHADGAATLREYYDIKGQYAADQLAVVNAITMLENSKITLMQLLNLPYDRNQRFKKLDEIPVLPEDISAQQLYESATQSLAAIKAVNLRQESAIAGVRATRAGYYPSVFLNAGLNTNYSSSAFLASPVGQGEVETGDFVDVNGSRYPIMQTQVFSETREIPYFDQLRNNRSTYVSLGVSIPVFNSFRTRNTISLAKLDRRTAEINVRSTKTRLQQQVEQAYYNLNFSKDRYAILQEQMSAFTESFRVAETRFTAGAINSVEYLVAKNNADRVNLNLIAGKYDLLLRKKIVEFYQGNTVW